MIKRICKTIVLLAIVYPAVSLAESLALSPIFSGVTSDEYFRGIGVDDNGEVAWIDEQTYSHAEFTGVLQYKFDVDISLPENPTDYHHRREVGYMVYDLTGVNFEVQVASVNVDLDTTNSVFPLPPGVPVPDGYADHKISLVESLSPANFSDVSESELPALHDSLWSGNTTVSSLSANGLHVFELNQAALDAINGGDFLVLALKTPGSPTLAYGTDVRSLPTLHVSSVPLPAAAWLFGSAVLGLGVLRRRTASSSLRLHQAL